jgi:hypothetical protein
MEDSSVELCLESISVSSDSSDSSDSIAQQCEVVSMGKLEWSSEEDEAVIVGGYKPNNVGTQTILSFDNKILGKRSRIDAQMTKLEEFYDA